MYNFIVNPHAGFGRGFRVWAAISRYLEGHSIGYEVWMTAGPGDARAAACELTEGSTAAQCIIAVGGDGTFNEILDGLAFHAPLSLGYIPVGGGSELSRRLHIPLNPLKCLRRQLEPRHFSLLDYGVLSFGSREVAHRRFLVGAGIGYEAAVCQDLKACGLARFLRGFGLARLACLISGLRQLPRTRSCRGYIVLDGVKKIEFNNILYISCRMQPTAGGGFLPAPRGGGNGSGRMRVCVFSHVSRRRLLAFLLPFGGGGRARGVRSYECSALRVHTEAVLPLHVDGEACEAQSDLQADCIPRKLRMMV